MVVVVVVVVGIGYHGDGNLIILDENWTRKIMSKHCQQIFSIL